MLKSIFVALALAVSLVPNILATDDVIKLHGRVGFVNGEDSIVRREFIDGGRKVIIVGKKTLQVWDVENVKLLSSATHDMQDNAPRGFVNNVLLLGIPGAMYWSSYIVDPNGKWIAMMERPGPKLPEIAVIRDLATMKRIATLELPNGLAISDMSYDTAAGTISARGSVKLDTTFASWDAGDFKLKETYTIPGYKWHRRLGDGSKMVVGAGESNLMWTVPDKQGASLTIRDVKSGAVEKEFRAEGVDPKTSFYETFVTDDEKYLYSRRDNRVFVWELGGDGGGKPFIDISKPTPKSKLDLERVVSQRFVVVFIDNELRVFDIRRGGPTPVLVVTPANPKQDLDFSGITGDRYALVRVDARLRVYDLATGKALTEIAAEDDPKDKIELRDVAEDGSMIAVSDDRRALIFKTSAADNPFIEIRRDSVNERFRGVAFYDGRGLVGVTRVNDKEKKPPRVEFYDTQSGKQIFKADNFDGSEGARFSEGNDFLLQERLGGVDVWNAGTNQSYMVPLDIYTPETTDATGNTTYGDPYNTEHVIFSPDFRHFVRDGKFATVFETATGRQVQTLIDPSNAKYDKQLRLQSSGIDDLNWAIPGKILFSTPPARWFKKEQTMSLWRFE